MSSASGTPSTASPSSSPQRVTPTAESPDPELYDVLAKYNIGRNSSVYLVDDRLRKRRLVAKVVSYAGHPEALKDCLREVEIRHAAMDAKIDMKMVKPINITFDHTRQTCTFLFEHYAYGCLATFYGTTNGQLLIRNENVLRSLIFDVVFSLSMLHSKGIIHRDLKPDNVMISINSVQSDPFHSIRSIGNSKTLRGLLTDFGISRTVSSDSKMTPTMMCAASYRAPEALMKDAYSFPAEVWSIGCFVYYVVTGEYMFCDSAHEERPDNPFVLLHNIASEYQERKEFHDLTVTAHLKKTTAWNWRDRLKLLMRENGHTDAFIQDVCDFYQSCHVFYPHKRPTCDQLINKTRLLTPVFEYYQKTCAPKTPPVTPTTPSTVSSSPTSSLPPTPPPPPPAKTKLPVSSSLGVVPMIKK